MISTRETPDCRITIDQGTIKGSVADGVCVYRGIPYAQAMTGDLRFESPLPAKSWSGELDATKSACIAPQNRSRLAAAMGDFSLPQDEDYLTLDICSPAENAEGLPVIIWLHGGAFSSGAGSLPWYSGTNMSRNGRVVTACVNYRLGALGFLYLPGVSTGNLGLKDQLLAIQWVKDNIRSFGGDPDNITLAGQSAGGASIAALLTMPHLDGLFRRAIFQSASVGRLFSTPEDAEKIGHQFLKTLGLGFHEAHKLKQLPVAQLLNAQQALGMANYKLAQTKPPFWLVRDGDFIRSELMESLGENRRLNVDLLIGTTREEMTAFYHFDNKVQQADDKTVAAIFHGEFGEQAAAYHNAYKKRRALPTAAAILGDLYTDQVFRLPSLELAELFDEKGLTAYAYQFDWQSPHQLQACHCLEIPFVFNNLENWDDSPMLQGLDRAEFEGLSRAMQNAWIAFAHSGNPNHSGIPAWDRYTAPGRSVMHFDLLITSHQARRVGENT